VKGIRESILACRLKSSAYAKPRRIQSDRREGR
jgi:hypothetical protein